MTSKDFYLRFYPLHFCPILMLEKEPEFPFFMLRAKQGNHGTIFITSLVWHGLDWGLNPGPPALETSSLPLGYRGGRQKEVILRGKYETKTLQQSKLHNNSHHTNTSKVANLNEQFSKVVDNFDQTYIIKSIAKLIKDNLFRYIVIFLRQNKYCKNNIRYDLNQWLYVRGKCISVSLFNIY